nr:MAG TPA: hypothetical protein [Caudoviricetes sp.]
MHLENRIKRGRRKRRKRLPSPCPARTKRL